MLEASTCHAEITSRLDDMSVTKTSRDQRVVLQNEDKEPTLLKLISDRRLFQNETVAVGWVPLRTSSHNVHVMTEMIDGLAVSRQADTCRPYVTSFSSLTNVPFGLRFIIDLYSNEEGNIDIVKQHILCHLKEIVRLKCRRNIILFIHTHTNVNFDDVMNFVKNEMKFKNVRKLFRGFSTRSPAINYVSESKM